MTAETLMPLTGCTGFLLTLWWVRRRHLSERQALAWMALALAVLLCGLFPRLLTSAAEAMHLSYPAAVLLVALALGYAFAFGTSVAYTDLNRRQVTLLQHLALLEQRVRELEAERQVVEPKGWTDDA